MNHYFYRQYPKQYSQVEFAQALEYGLKNLDVEVKGPGPGRESAVRALNNCDFEVPSDIPVLNSNPSSDDVNIEVRAGIRNNGASNFPIEYPFYKTQIFSFPYEAEKQIPFDLQFEY